MRAPDRRRRLIEPLFNLESHRYQTIQAADWIAGLVGRLGAIWAAPTAYPEYAIFRRYFEQRLSGFAGWSFFLSLPAVGVGVAVSTSVGIFFGIYPARQAAQYDPIKALRA